MRTLVRFDPFAVPRSRWLPRLDVLERDGAWIVRAETPGLDADGIDVTVEGDVLTISGKRSFEAEEQRGDYLRREIYQGSFRRSVRLPESAIADDIAASFKDGILEVSIPRTADVLPKKVKVEVS